MVFVDSSLAVGHVALDLVANSRTITIHPPLPHRLRQSPLATSSKSTVDARTATNANILMTLISRKLSKTHPVQSPFIVDGVNCLEEKTTIGVRRPPLI